MNLILPIILCLWSGIRPIAGACGYSACHKTDPTKLNIHLIPHSHDDVGWMVTADDYYTGETRQIITNVVKSLQLNTQRKFTQVEIYFFHRWWLEQNQQVRDEVVKLVQSGQLVFSNGGWTVNDEGAAHYNNIIDQMTLGLRFLNDTFGECAHPKISWQIDPFGASREMPSLYAQMGFDAHVVNRGPNPKGEYVWHTSDDLNTKIFTTVLHNHYSAPNGFNFENGNNALNDNNRATKSNDMVNVGKTWNQNYGNTNQVLVTMGDDFQYRNAENWFSNMDKLIEAVKSSHSDVDIFYSTPNCYIYAVNSENKTFTERNVDYLTYWVGYYSNRPALKYQDRITNNILQASKQLDVLSRLDTTRSKVHLDEARNQVAVLTHHDAITGTSPQATADDYTQRLQSGYAAAKAVIQKAYYYLKDRQHTDSTQVFCDSLNITECSLTETNDKIAVTAYNPIARSVSQYLSVPVISGNYAVYDSVGQKVSPTSLLAVSDAVKHLPERSSKATHELIFKAHLPALGFTTYFVEKQPTDDPLNYHGNNDLQSIGLNRKKRAVADLKGKSFTIQIDETTGAFKSITLNNKTHNLKQSFKYYKSIAAQSGLEDSGSYHFCPDGSAHDLTEKFISRQTSGGVHELQQQFSDYVKQTVRTFEDEDYIELDWTVGPIPVDSAGKEVITRFETDLKTDNIFYTDANGRQTIKRKYNPNSKGCTGNVITGNWYPIYSRASIRDEAQGLELTVLTDRTEGGSSLTIGELEMMVHRRLTRNGAGGSFTVNEPGVDGKGLIVRGKHYVFFQPITSSAQLFRSMSESLFMGPILSFDKYSTIKDFSAQREVSFSGLSHSLPENIHLLTLENWKPNQVLLRLEHMYESSDNIALAKPVDVNLNGVFNTFKVLDAVETTLGANEVLSASKRLQWKSQTYVEEHSNRWKRAVDLNVRLNPQQIRTFVLTVEDNTHKEAKCTYSWVKTTQQTIPKEALVAGYDIHNEPLNICRHLINNTDLIAGKADQQLGCVATFGGKEIQNSEFEVLEANNVEWVSRHGSDPIPDHALIAGDKPGAHTYIGRCHVRNSVQVGKIDFKFYYGFENKEWSDCPNHEVLVCVQ